MKRILFAMLLAILIIGGCSSEDESVSTSASSEDEIYELNINNWNASTHHYVYNVYEPWKELVEEKTDGRVQVNIHHGSSLGAASSVYQDVSGGLYELALLVTTYFDDTAFFPYTIGSLPFAFDNPKDASDVLTEIGDEFVRDTIDDVILLNPTSTDPYDIFSTTKVESVEDLKGKKMRVNGKGDVPFVEALGAVPVNMATDEVYEALERDTMDAMFYTSIGAIGNRFHEPAPYVAKLGANAAPMVPIMNKNFFESLPEDIQQMFEDEFNQKLTDLFNESYTVELDESHEILKEELSDRGGFIELSDDVIADFREKGVGSWDVWVEEAEKSGYDGEAILDFFINSLEEKGLPLPF